MNAELFGGANGGGTTCCEFRRLVPAAIAHLPPKERAMLAESPWESLVDPFKIPAEIDDGEAVALARERDRQLETGEVQAFSHEEMMSRLRR